MGHSNHAPAQTDISKAELGGCIAEESTALTPVTRTGMKLRPRRQKGPKCVNKMSKISSAVTESTIPTDRPSKKRAIRVAVEHHLKTPVGRKSRLRVSSSVPVRGLYQEVIERLCIHLAVRTMHREFRLFLWLAGVPNLSGFLAYTRLKARFKLKEFDVVRVQVLHKQNPVQWLEVGDHGVGRPSKPAQSEHKSFREVLLENLIRRPGKVYEGYVSIMVNAN